MKQIIIATFFIFTSSLVMAANNSLLLSKTLTYTGKEPVSKEIMQTPIKNEINDSTYTISQQNGRCYLNEFSIYNNLKYLKNTQIIKCSN